MYAKKGKITPESKEKSKFRQSAKWKKFRAFLKKEYKNKDAVTDKMLYKGFQVHHLDMRLENYRKLENIGRFIPVNRQTHEVIHWLYRYFETDPEIIDRLKDVLEKMKTYNAD